MKRGVRNDSPFSFNIMWTKERGLHIMPGNPVLVRRMSMRLTLIVAVMALPVLAGCATVVATGPRGGHGAAVVGPRGGKVVHTESPRGVEYTKVENARGGEVTRVEGPHGGTVTKVEGPGGRSVVFVKRPELPAEVQPPKPRGGNWVWEPPHHVWRGGHYIWEPGHWEKERPGKRWAVGHYMTREDHDEWVPGHWE